MTDSTIPKVFAVMFNKLTYWDVRSVALSILNSCYWPTKSLKEIAEIKLDPIDQRDIYAKKVKLLDRISFDEGLVYSSFRSNNKMTQYRAKPGSILISKINARKKAIGIVPDENEVGFTIHFRTVEPDISKVNTTFLWLALRSLFCTNQFEIETGGQGKGEISESNLLNIQSPLPPISIQQKIVDYWQKAQEELKRISSEIQSKDSIISRSVFEQVLIQYKTLKKQGYYFAKKWEEIERWGVEFNRWDWTPKNLLNSKYPMIRLGEVAVINPTHFNYISGEEEISFVPMECVDDFSGSIQSPQVKKYKLVRNGYTKFSNNDVIWAKITPCMQNGKCAVATDLVNGMACGSTEFHVVRTKNIKNLLPEYIWVILRLYEVRQAAMRYFIGSAGQKRVPPEFLENLYIPFPDVTIQRKIFLSMKSIVNSLVNKKQKALNLSTQIKQDIESVILGQKKIEEIL